MREQGLKRRARPRLQVKLLKNYDGQTFYYLSVLEGEVEVRM